jgi:hypothetical protein
MSKVIPFISGPDFEAIPEIRRQSEDERADVANLEHFERCPVR